MYNKLVWQSRLLLLSNFYSRRLSEKFNRTLFSRLSENSKKDLLIKLNIDFESSGIPNISHPVVDAFLSPRAMLNHPFLVHFIRPSAKMSKMVSEFDLYETPIVTSPLIKFVGRATYIDASALKVIEIPLGTIIILRELAGLICNIHRNIEDNKPDTTHIFVNHARILSKLLFKNPIDAFFCGQPLIKNMSIYRKLLSSQTYHILGIFLILHEFGHISLGHNLDSDDDLECKRQEFSADIFAMQCQFAPKLGNPIFEPFRRIQIISVCNMFSIFDIALAEHGIPLEGYPSFAERREALLDHFCNSDLGIRESIRKFSETLSSKIS